MADKVQKIREEVVRLHNLLPVMDGDNISVNYADRICTALKMYIDSLQEEDVKDRFVFKAIPRLLDMIEPSERAKSYVTKLADAFDVEGYHTDAEIVRESLKMMNGEKVAMATMDEEPVSEDLEKAAEQDVCEVVNCCSATGIPNDHIPSWVHDAMINEFIHGAKWKEQQMMKDAYDAYVSYIRDNSEAVVYLMNTSITMPSHFPKRDLEEGDELKIVIIKED